MAPYYREPYENRSLGALTELTGAGLRSQAAALRASADARARAEAARGQNTSALILNLGNLAAGTVKNVVQEREKQKVITDERELDRRLTERMTRSGELPDVRELIGMGFHPARAATLAKDFSQITAADLADEQRTVAKFTGDLRWVRALPEAKRQAGWQTVREKWTGVGAPAEMFPEQYSHEDSAALLERAGVKTEAPPNLIQRDPEKDLVHPQTGAVVTPGTPKPPEGYTLTPGAQRYGADGQLIAEAPRAEPSAGSFDAYLESFAREKGRKNAGQLTPTERRTAKAQWEAAGRAPERPVSEPLEAVMVNGEAKLVPRSQAIGMTPATNRERTTEDERKSVGWYRQMRDAAATIDQLEDKLTEKELFQIQTLPHESLIGMVNRNQLSEAAKRYFRAFTQFSEARLRSVSGAAISTGEYQSDRQTYAKQFGETPALKEDRRRAREVVIDATKSRAGVAMPREALGDVVPGAVRDALSGVGDGRHTLSDGSVWIKQGGQIRKGS